jgi:hypothetical protein
MKKTFILLTAAVILAVAQKLSAQTFGGGITITGTTNAPLVSGGTILTNTFYLTLPAKTVTLSDIVSTNETVAFAYGVRVGTNANIDIIGVITNSFALPAGTNQSGSGTWTTNIPQQTIAISIVSYAQAQIGANTNTIYVP